MGEPYDYTQEDHVREVERALMYIAQAKRKCEEIAEELAKAGAEDRLVDGLRTAGAALRAEHNRLLNRSHFPVPEESAVPATPAADGAEEEQPPESQQRMAI